VCPLMARGPRDPRSRVVERERSTSRSRWPAATVPLRRSGSVRAFGNGSVPREGPRHPISKVDQRGDSSGTHRTHERTQLLSDSIVINGLVKNLRNPPMTTESLRVSFFDFSDYVRTFPRN
jgi:hypothetical protein